MKYYVVLDIILTIIMIGLGYSCGYFNGSAHTKKEITEKLFIGKAVQTISYPEFEKLINNN